MTPFKNKITPEQEANIRKHVEFLCFDPRPNMPYGFSMKRYRNICGTPSCSAGWLSVSLWVDNGEDKEYPLLGISYDSIVWFWCFGADWTTTDNTPVGAAARMLYLLEYGLPDNWKQIMNGKASYPKKIQVWVEKVKKIQDKLFNK